MINNSRINEIISKFHKEQGVIATSTIIDTPNFKLSSYYDGHTKFVVIEPEKYTLFSQEEIMPLLGGSHV